MTREEAINEIKSWDFLEGKEIEAIHTLIPELRESEDERIRKEIIDFIQWAEDRGMTRHDYHQAKRPAVWIAYLEKQKECVADSSKTSAEEDERIRARLIEYFQGFLEGYEDCYKDGGCVKWEGLDVKSILAWLEKQKETADSFTDGIIEVRSFQRGMEEGRKLERQKEPGIKWLKSDNVKNPDKPYVDKAGMFYTTDGRMCYASEIEQQKEQKPRWEINNPHTTKWTKEMIDEKIEELVEEYHKQKPVVTHGETYHVDTLGTQQVIAGKMPQKPAEWSEEDELNCNRIIRFLEPHKTFFPTKETKAEMQNWIKNLFKSAHPTPKQEWSEEDENVIETLIQELRLNVQFEIAVRKLGLDYVQTLTVLDKCRKLPFHLSWKPNEEQMESLRDTIINTKGYSYSVYLPELYEQLKKLR